MMSACELRLLLITLVKRRKSEAGELSLTAQLFFRASLLFLEGVRL